MTATAGDTASDRSDPPDARALQRILDGRWATVREQARELAADPRFAVRHGESTETQRERVLDRLRLLSETGYSQLGFPTRYGGRNDVGGSITGFEMLAMGDLSLLVKAGVQWGLFGGAVLHLGTERHHDAYLADIASGSLLGCFAMTERGHGSDVANVRTTATYDTHTGEFVIDTPDDAARKDYIGNAARDGRLAVVFAQLITGGEPRGVHAFVVPIRDAHGAPMPGVGIEDCGEKAGLNGVDNGRLAFSEVRIPRDNLLDRYGAVAADGSYSTPIENQTARFFTMLGTLVQGRISVAGGAGSATKVALAIAIRYGEKRRQFEHPDGHEIAVLDYLAHQRKLLPALAKTYALHFAQLDLVAGLHETTPDLDVPVEQQDPAEHPERRELETRAAGVKAVGTWHATATIQACREACGGAGYLAANRLPGLKADTDVFTTFEGDNTVLLQLVAKELLTGFRDHFGSLDLRGTALFVADQLRRDGHRARRRPAPAAAAARRGAGRRRPQRLRPRLAAVDVRRPGQAPGRVAGDAAAPGGGRRRPLRGVQRRAGPPAQRRPRPHRRPAARGVRRRHRPAALRPGEGPARRGLRPLRAVDDRGRPRLVPGARDAHRRPLEGGHRRGERALRRACDRTPGRSSTPSAFPSRSSPPSCSTETDPGPVAGHPGVTPPPSSGHEVVDLCRRDVSS